MGSRPDRVGLFQLASEQRGYFTTAQGAEYGHSRSLLAHYARTGTLHRVYRGVYRFRDFPSTPREELVAAWLMVGKEIAVVSHESALECWQLSDLIPETVHLSVPRTRRRLPRLPGVTIHTTTRPLDAGNVQTLEGLRITTPPRTLLDVADADIAPDQLSLAISQALSRGWIERDTLLSEAARRGSRTARLIRQAFDTDFATLRVLE
jgi:predicted transcriptional regulator of viral defense system